MENKKVDRTVHKNGLLRGLLKKEVLLLRPFVREPWKDFTLTQIKQITGNTSHHYAYNGLERFVSSGVIAKATKGNTNLYKIRADGGQSSLYLCIMEMIMREERKDIPYGNIARLMVKIRSPFYSLLVGGSYAEGKQKKGSDLDVAIIIPDGESKKQHEIALKEGELMVPEIHGFVFTQEEFHLMLTNPEFNYGKEIARKHVMIHGSEAYYSMLFRAMRNGFTG